MGRRAVQGRHRGATLRGVARSLARPNALQGNIDHRLAAHGHGYRDAVFVRNAPWKGNILHRDLNRVDSGGHQRKLEASVAIGGQRITTVEKQRDMRRGALVGLTNSVVVFVKKYLPHDAACSGTARLPGAQWNDRNSARPLVAQRDIHALVAEGGVRRIQGRGRHGVPEGKDLRLPLRQELPGAAQGSVRVVLARVGALHARAYHIEVEVDTAREEATQCGAKERALERALRAMFL